MLSPSTTGNVTLSTDNFVNNQSCLNFCLSSSFLSSIDAAASQAFLLANDQSTLFNVTIKINHVLTHQWTNRNDAKNK